MVKHNSGIGRITIVLNGQRVSGGFGCLDDITDEDAVEYMIKLAHRRLDELEIALKAKLAG